jgi:signal transduction histidine kinase
VLSTFRAVDRLRLISTGVLAAMLVLLSIFAGQRALVGRLEEAQDDRRSTQQELEVLVALWRNHVEQSIASWIKDLPFEASPGPVERRRRAAVPWFDGWLLLRPAGDGWEVAWPKASPHEDAAVVLADPCVADAAALQTRGQPAAAAQAFARCSGGPLPTQLHARLQAGRLYLSLGDPEMALSVLDDRELPLRLPFDVGVERGLDLRRLAQRIELAADAHKALRHESESTALRLFLADEILNLPGPQLLELLPVAERLVERDLSAATGQTRAQALARARRRVEAFAHIREHADTLGAAAQVGALSVRHAPGDFPAWALAWSAVPPSPSAPSGPAVAVVLLDSEALFRPVVRSVEGNPGAGYLLVDSQHHVIFGEGGTLDRNDHVEVEVGALFPGLRFASEQEASAVAGEVAEDLATVLAPVIAALLLSGAALSMQLTADRRARELSERQDAFIARVTHELKTPLAGIRVMAETLELGAAEDPATRGRFIGKILTECDNLGARIDEVLAAARRPELRATRTLPLDELARGVVSQWVQRFAARGAELRADLRPTVAVELDEHLMKDALGNLLDNALKYAKTGVKLRCEVRTYQHGSWAVVEVSDNGIGVPAHMRKQIFERFVRVEGPGRGKAGGHGLGLAFVAEAAAAHRGLVECSEGAEGGARFRLRLRDEKAGSWRRWASRFTGRGPTPKV